MPSSQIETLIAQLKQSMEQAQNPVKAVNMAAYLQNHFSCYGIKTPERTLIQLPWLKEVKALGLNHWDVAYHLWSLEQREFHYVAIDLLKKVPARQMLQSDHKNLEELLTHHSWWDSVDLLASNYVGKYFQTFPEMREPVIDRWRNSPNMWLNRTCLIFQLKYGKETDFDLLKSIVRQFQGNPEFFIQKAIGWSLRQYSKFKPEEVKRFIEEIHLKGLALREASKYL